MSRLIALFLATALAGAMAQAQQLDGQQPVQQVNDGEAILNEDVEESGVERGTTRQGLRPPEESVDEEGADLYSLLGEVRQAPPGLDGEPIPRPNDYASEPETEMEPVGPRDADLFPDDFIE